MAINPNDWELVDEPSTSPDEAEIWEPVNYPATIPENLISGNPVKMSQGAMDLFGSVMQGLGVGMEAQDRTTESQQSQQASLSPWSSGGFQPPDPGPQNAAQRADAAASARYLQEYNRLRGQLGQAMGVPLEMVPDDLVFSEGTFGPRMPDFTDLRMEEFGKEAGATPITTGQKLAAVTHTGLTQGAMAIPNTLSAIADISQIPKLLDAMEVKPPGNFGTGSWQGDLDQQFVQRKQAADRMRQQDEAIGAKGFGYETAGGIARGIVELPPYLLAGAGAPTAASAIGRVSAAAGLMGGGGRFAEDRGEGRTTGEALPGALASGAVTGLLTRAFGATGVESLLRKEGPMAVGQRLRQAAINVGLEIPEEMADTFGQQIVDRVDKGISRTFEEAAREILLSGVIAAGVSTAAVGPRAVSGAVSDTRAKRRADLIEQEIRRVTSSNLSPEENQEVERLFELRGKGQLNLEQQQRLDELSKKESLPITRDEIDSISESASSVGTQVEIHTEPDESLSGGIAAYRDGKILINPTELAAALEGLTDDQRKQAIRSILDEEIVHKFTPDDAALSFIRNASGIEKFIGRRRYTGTLSGKTIHGQEISEKNLGHEMLRLQVQRINKMTPNEIAQNVGAKRLTMQALVATENALFSMRKAMGTKASKAQVGYINQVLGKIEAAKAMIESGIDPEEFEAVDQTQFDAENAPFAMRQGEVAEVSPEAVEFSEAMLSDRTINNNPTNPDVISTQKTGMALRSVADLDAVLEARRKFVAAMESDRALMREGKLSPAELQKFATKMVKIQTPREVVETATNFGSWSEANQTSKDRPLGDRPLDWRKNPEVAEWLRKNGAELGIDVSQFDDQSDAPMAIRQGGGSKKSQILAEQRRRIAEMKAIAAGEEVPEGIKSKSQPASGSFRNPVPASERVSAEESGALPRLGAKELEAKAKEILESKITPRRTSLVEESAAPTGEKTYETKTEWSIPKFDDFADWALSNVQGSNREQIRDIWEDQVWSALIRATPEELEVMRKAFGLEDRRRAKKGLPQRSIVGEVTKETQRAESKAQGKINALNQIAKLDAKASELRQTLKNLRNTTSDRELSLFGRQENESSIAAQIQALTKKSAQLSALVRGASEAATPSAEVKLTPADTIMAQQTAGYRSKLVTDLAIKLIGQALKGRPSLEVGSVSIDDVDFHGKNSYFEITERHLRPENRDKLLTILRSGARGMASDPEAASHRTLAVVAQDGSVYLLSTYNDAGVQRVADPAGPSMKGKPSRQLSDSFMKQFRPFASVLLENPVRGLRQKFESMSEFMDKFGKEAQERSTFADTDYMRMQPGDPDFEADVPTSGKGGAGIEGEGGSFMGPAKKLYTDSPRGTSLQSRSPLMMNEARVLLKFIRSETGDIESAEDVENAIAGMVDLVKRGKATKKNILAAGALQKIYRRARIQNENISDLEINTRIAAAINSSFLKDITPEEALVAEFAGRQPGPRPLPVRVRNLPTSLQRPMGSMGTQRFPARFATKTRPKMDRIIREPSQSSLGNIPSREVSAKVIAARKIYLRTLKNRGVKLSFSNLAKMVGTEARNLIESAEMFDPNWKYVKAPPYSPLGEAKIEGPMSVRQKVKKGTLKMADMVEALGSVYDEWLVDRIERLGGPDAEVIAGVMRQIISREKELYGQLTPNLDRARVMAGGSKIARKTFGKRAVQTQIPSIKQMRATKWLSELSPIKPPLINKTSGKVIKGKTGKIVDFAANANVIDAIEGRALVPGYASELTSAAQQANLEAGLMMQPVIKGFKASGKFARYLTATAYDAIRDGKGPLYNKWVIALAYANNMPVREIRKSLTELKATLDQPGVDSESLAKANQDFARKVPRTVSHIKHGPTWVPMLHTDLFTYLENTARRASHIRAFREVFRNNPKGRKLLRDVMEGNRKQMGPVAQRALVTLMKTAQGIPSDDYDRFGAFSPTHLVGQALKDFNVTFGNLMAKMVLTGQMFVQPGEVAVGATPVFLGYKNMLRAMAKLDQLYPQMEINGAVNRAIHNFSIDSASPVKTAFRLTGNTIGKVFMEQTLNELQEALAAATAQVVADRIVNWDLTPWEKRMLPQTFRAMGFPENDVIELMNGNKDLLDQFKRKASAFLTSGNRAISEGSSLGANRLFGSIFRFQSYPMMKLNQFRAVTAPMLRAWADGTGREKRNTAEMWARFMFGAGAQGALTAAITTLAYYGLSGAKGQWEEFKEEPISFLIDSWAHTMSGPMLLLWRAANKELGGLGENMTRMMFPFGVAKELMDFSTGGGRYKDTRMWDRIGKFVKAKIPGTKALRTGAAMFGLSQENRELDAAERAFNKWSRDRGWTKVERWRKEDPRREFRIEMRKAVEALRVGDEESYFKHLELADDQLAEIGSSKKARSYMSTQRILEDEDGRKLTPELMDELREAIGEDAVEQLEYFDEMLEAAAQGKFQPPLSK
jgi:hypothetical protein